MAPAICSSLLPERMSARKSWPDCANRQVYSLPSVASLAWHTMKAAVAHEGANPVVTE